MRTRYVSRVDLDADRLAKELELSSTFHHSEAYSDYLCGGPWRSCMLWAGGGDAGDGLVANYAYDQPPRFTEYGRQLPYLQELINRTVDTRHLTFVRLAVISNSVIIPHRDLIELTDLPEDVRIAHRMHIPLVTDEDAFFSEDDVVYRMRAGEVWFFDASRIHSAVSLSERARTHLILDFVDHADGSPFVLLDQDGGGGIPAGSVREREPLPDTDRRSLLRLGEVITGDNYRDVFSIVIKKHFRYDGGPNFVWDTMCAIGHACPDPAVGARIAAMRRYFTLERSA